MTSCKCAISAGSSDFLDVVFNTSWHVIVDHGLNVRLIDSHTEGNGAAQDSDLVSTELLLRECSLLVTFACMIGGTLNSLLAQVAGNLLRGLALCREEKN